MNNEEKIQQVSGGQSYTARGFGRIMGPTRKHVGLLEISFGVTSPSFQKTDVAKSPAAFEVWKVPEIPKIHNMVFLFC